MARLQEDVRRLRFWRGIIAELLGSLFVVFVGCAAFTVTYDEHSLAVKVSLNALASLSHLTVITDDHYDRFYRAMHYSA